MKFAPLDKLSSVPLYHQLKAVLLEKLSHGDWKPNERLPTEDELCSQFGVSRATVRQALRDLAQAGYVRAEQGRGTFVSESKVQYGPRRLSSFTEEMVEFGLPTGSRVLEAKILGADDAVAEKLRVTPGTEICRLQRLRLAGGEPMGLETVHIVSALVPDFFSVDYETASLYATLEKRYGLLIDHATQKHFAVAVDRKQAALLKVPAGSPAIGGERLTFLSGGRPMELTASVMRGDRYQIELSLVRALPQ